MTEAWEGAPQYVCYVIEDAHGNRSMHSDFVEATPQKASVAASDHVHTASQVVDLAEAVQDVVAGFVKAGSGCTVTYDDSAGTFTIDASGGGGGTGTTDPEIVRDVIGSALVAGSGVQITLDDAGDRITIAAAAHAATHRAGGTDQLSVTDLAVGTLTEGQMLVRSGSALVGQAVPTGGGAAVVPGTTQPITTTGLPSILKLASYASTAWTAGQNRRISATWAGTMPATGVMRFRVWASGSDSFTSLPLICTPLGGGLVTSGGGIYVDVYAVKAISSSATIYPEVWAEVFWTAA